MRLHHLLLLVLVAVYPTMSEVIAVRGSIKDRNGKPIPNALIRCKQQGYVAVSTTNGGFTLSDLSPVQPRQPLQKSVEGIRIADGSFLLTITGGEPCAFAVHTLRGQLCAQKRIVLQISTSVYQVLNREADSYAEVGHMLDRIAGRTRGR